MTSSKSVQSPSGSSKGPKLPLLRGKINLLFFLIFPIVLFKIFFKQQNLEKIPFLIFSMCAAFNFLSSIVLHWRIWDQEEYSVLRRIDYAGIFLMIGGGGIPTYSLLMNNDFMVILGLVHWALIFTGVFSSLLFNFCYTTKRTRSYVYVLISTPYYVLLPLFVRSRYPSALVSLIMAGLTYTVGAFVYGFKFPNLIPGVFEYHELFHIFCLLGFAGTSMANFFICKNDRSTVLQRVFESKY
ncbi:hypothetical protein MACK_002597 [Theileria orientalis]|uniref:Hemolysin III n=1 Tax=Theileria orientalis TaxID=68886 RepID=A0A976MD73_THEOR|nr:hypothetical protein MACK_002597 [Theileria orientalis]